MGGRRRPSPIIPLPQVQQAGPSLEATAPPGRQLLQLPLGSQLPLGALPFLPPVPPGLAQLALGDCTIPR